MLDLFAILIGKCISFFTALFGGGTNLPGKIVLKIRPHILQKLSSGYKIIMITGTNGKTTSTGMLQKIIELSGKRVILSESGANMLTGIAACFVKHYSLTGKNNGSYAVLEVDEAHIRGVVSEITPDIIAVTNIFRDQTDRYGSIENTISMIKEACDKAPGAIVVLNADQGNLIKLSENNRTFYYGFGVPIPNSKTITANDECIFCPKCHAKLSYNFVTINNTGDYYCNSCGAQRPTLDFKVSKIKNISAQSSEIECDNININVAQPGVYNIYNALCAASCAKVLGVPNEYIINGIAEQKSRFGRQEIINIDSHEVRMILVKNPSGANEAINSVLSNNEDIRIGFLLSDGTGDGHDISWIYDVDFENLATLNYSKILIGGPRAYDMAVRLKTAGLNTVKFSVAENFDAFLSLIQSSYNSCLYLFTTYTSMINFRKYLYKKHYIKKLWF